MSNFSFFFFFLREWLTNGKMLPCSQNMHYILDANRFFFNHFRMGHKVTRWRQEENSFHLHTRPKVDLGEVAQHSSKSLTAFTFLSLEIMCLCISECWKNVKIREEKALGEGLRSFITLGYFHSLLRIQGNSRKVVWREESG